MLQYVDVISIVKFGFFQNHRQTYKQAFVDKVLWKVLSDTLRYCICLVGPILIVLI
jgi:hypothetical protein